MIDILFAVMIIIGVVFQLASIHWESWILSILTTVWFVKLMADSLNIQQLIVYQPIVVNNTVVNGSYSLTSFSDYGLNAIFLLFILINIVLAIYYKTTSTVKSKYKLW